jgi:hypothetical protein
VDEAEQRSLRVTMATNKELIQHLEHTTRTFGLAWFVAMADRDTNKRGKPVNETTYPTYTEASEEASRLQKLDCVHSYMTDFVRPVRSD